jgi:hypothetical protein
VNGEKAKSRNGKDSFQYLLEGYAMDAKEKQERGATEKRKTMKPPMHADKIKNEKATDRINRIYATS